jgi:acetoin utilization deacetylase AcuC-like enzyme
MAKYRLLYDRVRAAAREWNVELLAAAEATDAQLQRVHDSDYVQRVIRGELSQREVRRIGFPWSSALVTRSRRSTGGTIAAARAALEDGVAANLAGGTHHAFAGAGQGFCVFNDVAVAARTLQHEARVRRVVIIDCDVHQGNGTAAIFHQDASVFTFSMHGDRNFPFRKTAGDLDIALPDDTEDADYLRILNRALTEQVPLADADLVFYLAGADPYRGDRLGRLRLTKAGLAQRDQLVLAACCGRGVSVAIAMAGGYADAVEDIVDIHAETIRRAALMSRS